jgi:FAD/FMN-containing dehydrogenase
MTSTLSPVTDPFTTAALRGLFDGRAADRVHLPGDPGYDAARVAWNLAVDQRPAAVVSVASVEEVTDVVRTAALAGLRVAPQTTGHNAMPLAARGVEDVVIVRTGLLDSVSHDPARGTVRVGGGALWEPVVDAAAAHGRAVLHGSSPDVGVAGYALGGGMGWYARKLGLAANSITGLEVVIGDGTLVRADADTNPELFWALRGGGGSFGVVTAMELRSFDIETAYAGMLMWDLRDAEQVLRAWAAWAPTAPEEVTTSFRILRLPPLPELPDFIRGRAIVVIDGAVLGTDERAEEILAGLRALRPELDTFGRVPAPALCRIHMDPEGGAPVVSRTATLRSMPDAAVDAFLAAVGPDADTTLTMAELRQLGGALGRPAEDAGALSHLDGQFVAFGGAMAPTPELGALGAAAAGSLIEAIEPFASGRPYLNFVETAGETRAAYPEETWLQLKGIRSAVDPYGVFAANHPVPRLYEGGRPTA